MAQKNDDTLRKLVVKTLITSIISIFVANFIGVIWWSVQFRIEKKHEFNLSMIEVVSDVTDAFSEYKISRVYSLEIDIARQEILESEGDDIDSEEYFAREERIKAMNEFGYEKSKNIPYYYSKLIRKLDIAQLYFNDPQLVVDIQEFASFLNKADFNVYLDEYAKHRLERGDNPADVFPDYPDSETRVNYIIDDYMTFVDFYLENRFLEIYNRLKNEIKLSNLEN